MVNPILFVLLAAPSFQTELMELGEEVTGLEINACKGHDVLSCVLAVVNLSAFDDDVLVLPGGVELTKKNDIQELKQKTEQIEEKMKDIEKRLHNKQMINFT